MSSALVVGSRGTGLSTFLGLLYTAEVRRGSEAADEFRFHVERESIRRLEGIYGELGDGRFPESEVDWGRYPLTFLFGYRRPGLGHTFRGRPSPEGEFFPNRVEIGGLSTEEAIELSGRDAVLDSTTRRLLRSSIVVPIVDATLLPASDQDPGSRIAAEDHRLAQALDLLIRFVAAERSRRARRLFPLFVLTKSDRLPEAAARCLGGSGSGLEAGTAAERAAFGDRLLAAFLPETRRCLVPASAARVAIAKPAWFFSRLALEPSPDHPIRRRWRVPAGGWEPDYPFEEYRALLDRLGEIVQRLPADPND